MCACICIPPPLTHLMTPCTDLLSTVTPAPSLNVCVWSACGHGEDHSTIGRQANTEEEVETTGDNLKAARVFTLDRISSQVWRVM